MPRMHPFDLLSAERLQIEVGDGNLILVNGTYAGEQAAVSAGLATCTRLQALELTVSAGRKSVFLGWEALGALVEKNPNLRLLKVVDPNLRLQDTAPLSEKLQLGTLMELHLKAGFKVCKEGNPMSLLFERVAASRGLQTLEIEDLNWNYLASEAMLAAARSSSIKFLSVRSRQLGASMPRDMTALLLAGVRGVAIFGDLEAPQGWPYNQHFSNDMNVLFWVLRENKTCLGMKISSVRLNSHEEWLITAVHALLGNETIANVSMDWDSDVTGIMRKLLQDLASCNMSPSMRYLKALLEDPRSKIHPRGWKVGLALLETHQQTLRERKLGVIRRAIARSEEELEEWKTMSRKHGWRATPEIHPEQLVIMSKARTIRIILKAVLEEEAEKKKKGKSTAEEEEAAPEAAPPGAPPEAPLTGETAEANLSAVE